MRRRRILIALLVLAAFPLTWAAVTAVRAYLVVPQLVAELDLPFDEWPAPHVMRAAGGGNRRDALQVGNH